MTKTSHKPLETHELQHGKLELGPGQPIQAHNRESSLLERSNFTVAPSSLFIILKIQKQFRRNIAKLRRDRLEAERPKLKYFTEEDFKETFSGSKVYEKDGKVEERPAYKFKSGAVYTG